MTSEVGSADHVCGITSLMWRETLEGKISYRGTPGTEQTEQPSQHDNRDWSVPLISEFRMWVTQLKKEDGTWW